MNDEQTTTNFIKLHALILCNIVDLNVALDCIQLKQGFGRNDETDVYLKMFLTLLFTSANLNVHTNCKPHVCRPTHVCTHWKPHIFWLGNFLLSNPRDLEVSAARFFAIFRE